MVVGNELQRIGDTGDEIILANNGHSGHPFCELFESNVTINALLHNITSDIIVYAVTNKV